MRALGLLSRSSTRRPCDEASRCPPCSTTFNVPVFPSPTTTPPFLSLECRQRPFYLRARARSLHARPLPHSRAGWLRLHSWLATLRIQINKNLNMLREVCCTTPHLATIASRRDRSASSGPSPLISAVPASSMCAHMCTHRKRVPCSTHPPAAGRIALAALALTGAFAAQGVRGASSGGAGVRPLRASAACCWHPLPSPPHSRSLGARAALPSSASTDASDASTARRLLRPTAGASEAWGEAACNGVRASVSSRARPSCAWPRSSESPCMASYSLGDARVGDANSIAVSAASPSLVCESSSEPRESMRKSGTGEFAPLESAPGESGMIGKSFQLKPRAFRSRGGSDAVGASIGGGAGPRCVV